MAIKNFEKCSFRDVATLVKTLDKNAKLKKLFTTIKTFDDIKEKIDNYIKEYEKSQEYESPEVIYSLYLMHINCKDDPNIKELQRMIHGFYRDASNNILSSIIIKYNEDMIWDKKLAKLKRSYDKKIDQIMQSKWELSLIGRCSTKNVKIYLEENSIHASYLNKLIRHRIKNEGRKYLNFTGILPPELCNTNFSNKFKKNNMLMRDINKIRNY